MPPILAIIAFDILAMAPLCAWLAVQRGRSPSGWLILGALIGPFALAALGSAPTAWELRDRRARTRPCERCLTLVPGAATRCYACGATLTPILPEVATTSPLGDTGATLAEAPGAAPGASPVEPSPPSGSPRPVGLPGSTGRRSSRPMARPLTVPAPEPRPFLVAVAPSAAASPTAGGLAPSDEAPVAAARATPPRPVRRRRLIPSDIVTVATGALVGGDVSVGIGELGERFVVGTADESVVVFGPIGAAQEKVVLEAPRDNLEVTRVPDGFVLTAEPEPGRRVRIAFRNTAAAEVERAIAQLDPDNRPISHLAAASEPEAPDGGGRTRPSRAPRRARSPS